MTERVKCIDSDPAYPVVRYGFASRCERCGHVQFNEDGNVLYRRLPSEEVVALGWSSVTCERRRLCRASSRPLSWGEHLALSAAYLLGGDEAIERLLYALQPRKTEA